MCLFVLDVPPAKCSTYQPCTWKFWHKSFTYLPTSEIALTFSFSFLCPRSFVCPCSWSFPWSCSCLRSFPCSCSYPSYSSCPRFFYCPCSSSYPCFYFFPCPCFLPLFLYGMFVALVLNLMFNVNHHINSRGCQWLSAWDHFMSKIPVPYNGSNFVYLLILLGTKKKKIAFLAHFGVEFGQNAQGYHR